MKLVKRMTAMFLAVLLVFAVTACGSKNDSAGAGPVTIIDREGREIELPAKTDKIISMAASITETLIDLGLGDRIIAADIYSEGINGLKSGLPLFDMMNPDAETMAAMGPDLIFASGMSRESGGDPFKPVTDLGVVMTYIPSSDSIAEIKNDIRFIGRMTGTDARAEAIIGDMEKEIEEINMRARASSQYKTVYFEISAAPYLYSSGGGTFLNEMIELVCAENILAGQDSWLSVSEETVIDKNPDVIFTNVNYIDDPIGEIKSRPGWGVITAAAENQVFYIDTDSSSRPNEFIVKAMREMARALHPGLFD